MKKCFVVCSVVMLTLANSVCRSSKYEASGLDNQEKLIRFYAGDNNSIFTYSYRMKGLSGQN